MSPSEDNTGCGIGQAGDKYRYTLRLVLTPGFGHCSAVRVAGAAIEHAHHTGDALALRLCPERKRVPVLGTRFVCAALSASSLPGWALAEGE